MRLQVGFFTVSIVKRRIKKICLGEISKKGKSILQWARKKNVQRRRKCIQLWVSINYLNKIAKGNEKYEPKKRSVVQQQIRVQNCMKLTVLNTIAAVVVRVVWSEGRCFIALYAFTFRCRERGLHAVSSKHIYQFWSY